MKRAAQRDLPFLLPLGVSPFRRTWSQQNDSPRRVAIFLKDIVDIRSVKQNQILNLMEQKPLAQQSDHLIVNDNSSHKSVVDPQFLADQSRQLVII
jgi:hypothetical protein